MAFQIKRFDYTKPDTFYTSMPKSKRTVKAELLYNYCQRDSRDPQGEQWGEWGRYKNNEKKKI